MLFLQNRVFLSQLSFHSCPEILRFLCKAELSAGPVPGWLTAGTPCLCPGATVKRFRQKQSNRTGSLCASPRSANWASDKFPSPILPWATAKQEFCVEDCLLASWPHEMRKFSTQRNLDHLEGEEIMAVNETTSQTSLQPLSRTFWVDWSCPALLLLLSSSSLHDPLCIFCCNIASIVEMFSWLPNDLVSFPCLWVLSPGQTRLYDTRS